MRGLQRWWRNNVDQKQLVTLVASSVVIGVGVYSLRKAGMGKVANVVKGG